MEYNLMDYGLSPRAITAIVFGWTACALAIWLGYRWRAARIREFGEPRDR